MRSFPLALVALSFIASSAGTAYSQSFHLSGSDSQAAVDLLSTRFPSQAGGSADIVFKADAGVADASVHQRLDALFADVAKVPQVAEVISPYADGGQRQISADGKIAYAQVNFSVEENSIDVSTSNRLIALVDRANGDGLQVEGGGDVFGSRKGLGSTELIGLLAAVVILLIAFGSLLAMGLPASSY